jgi:hypothetical protein
VVTGHRHGSRTRTLTGTFGKTEIAVPRARLNTSDGKDQGMEEPSAAELSAPHAGRRCADRGYLSGRTNTRRVRRVLYALFGRRSRQGHHEPSASVRGAPGTFQWSMRSSCPSAGVTYVSIKYLTPARCAIAPRSRAVLCR